MNEKLPKKELNAAERECIRALLDEYSNTPIQWSEPRAITHRNTTAVHDVTLERNPENPRSLRRPQEYY